MAESEPCQVDVGSGVGTELTAANSRLVTGHAKGGMDDACPLPRTLLLQNSINLQDK